jgi:Helix-turn-helix domain
MNQQQPTEPGEEDTTRWTAKMVAQRCGVDRTTVYDWIKAGRLPPGVEHLEGFAHQRVFVVRVAELDAWVRTGKTL